MENKKNEQASIYEGKILSKNLVEILSNAGVLQYGVVTTDGENKESVAYTTPEEFDNTMHTYFRKHGYELLYMNTDTFQYAGSVERQPQRSIIIYNSMDKGNNCDLEYRCKQLDPMQQVISRLDDIAEDNEIYRVMKIKRIQDKESDLQIKHGCTIIVAALMILISYVCSLSGDEKITIGDLHEYIKKMDIWTATGGIATLICIKEMMKLIVTNIGINQLNSDKKKLEKQPFLGQQKKL